MVEEPRPKIAKLVAMITDRVPAKLKGVKGNDPEYWGLADLISDEMADVALKMGVRKPKTIGQLMKLTKLEREPLQKLLDDMAWVGLIEYNWESSSPAARSSSICAAARWTSIPRWRPSSSG